MWRLLRSAALCRASLRYGGLRVTVVVCAVERTASHQTHLPESGGEAFFPTCPFARQSCESSDNGDPED